MRSSSEPALRGLSPLLHRRRVTRGTESDFPGCQKISHEPRGFSGLHRWQALAPHPVQADSGQCLVASRRSLHVPRPLTEEEGGEGWVAHGFVITQAKTHEPVITS
jgi:hypothetical protein